ncbi:hypothetical protein SprV_0200799800 [Sparganum proliferum]
MESTASPPRKPKVKHANLSCARPATPTPNRPQRVHSVKRHSGRQMDLLDTFGLTAALGLHQPSSLCPSLPRLLRRYLKLTALPHHHCHPPPPPPTASTSIVVISVTYINITHNPETSTPPALTLVVRTWSTLVLIVTAPSPHASAWSATCVSITQIGKPVPGAPNYIRRIPLHCPHCSRTFMHRMGLPGRTRFHVSGIDRNLDTINASSTPTMPSPAQRAHSHQLRHPPRLALLTPRRPARPPSPVPPPPSS